MTEPIVREIFITFPIRDNSRENHEFLADVAIGSKQFLSYKCKYIKNHHSGKIHVLMKLNEEEDIQ